MMDLVGELGVILFCVILSLIVLPLLVGIGVAFLLGANGLTYYTIVILTASVLWFVTAGWWWTI